VWDWYPAHPREHDRFIWGMNGFTQVHCREVVQAFDFSRFRKVVDVGGGGGVLIREILQVNPQLHGVLFDQPRTIEEAEPRLADAGLAQRCKAVGGNFLEELPPDADAYIFKHVLRDWDDASVLTMLRNCHRAMADNGTLLVIDAILDPTNNTDRLLKLVDVQMMVDGGGGLRTLQDFQEFFRQAGFELRKVHRTTIIDMNIIEARRLSESESDRLSRENGRRHRAAADAQPAEETFAAVASNGD
jgi:ubiquinone/menaquinone biosynthesis C-methylase UbiE